MSTVSRTPPRRQEIRQDFPGAVECIAAGSVLLTPEGRDGIEPTVERSGTVGEQAKAKATAPEGGDGGDWGGPVPDSVPPPPSGAGWAARASRTHSSASLHCGLYSAAPFGG